MTISENVLVLLSVAFICYSVSTIVLIGKLTSYFNTFKDYVDESLANTNEVLTILSDAFEGADLNESSEINESERTLGDERKD